MSLKYIQTKTEAYHLTDETFKCISLNENYCILIPVWLKLSPSVQQVDASIGIDNGLVLNRCQAIIWTNGGIVYWCVHASHSLDESWHIYFNTFSLSCFMEYHLLLNVMSWLSYTSDLMMLNQRNYNAQYGPTNSVYSPYDAAHCVMLFPRAWQILAYNIHWSLNSW